MIDDLKKYKHIHLIGIGGISMSAIAETLKNWGFKVTGSDLVSSSLTDKLNKHGIETTIGHNLKNVKEADLIVYSAAIKDNDPEMVVAKENMIPLIDRGSFVGYLTKLYKESICIAGTHGKTTVTSMVSVCFLEASLDPSIEVGAILKEINGNYRVGNSDYFILESCEYMGNFLKFNPNAEIVLDIDSDHLDYYKTFDNVVKAFQDFAKLLDPNGVLVVNGDDKNCLGLEKYTNAKFITYGIKNINCNFVSKNIVFNNDGFPTFDVYKNKEFFGNFELSVAGEHNVSNALACISICDYYNIDKKYIYTALKKFTGASRRLEFKGKFNNISVYDDYAHHPTEILATAEAIKNKKYNSSWAIFQPHTYSRTLEHLNEFANSLSEFDNIILTDIYAAREINTFGITSEDLKNEIIKLGKNAIYISSFEKIVEYIKENSKPNDLVLTLGAGTVTDIGSMLLK
ncbi:MAG: UDP-N-acetylmuramate--L-alanine ligase [Candidatus Scatovivens sp.]